MMDDCQLTELAESLEEEAVDAKTRITRCNAQHLLGLTGNRAGLLHLAASCLRAAAAPIEPTDSRSRPVEIGKPHDQVVSDESDCVICFLQRLELWPEPNECIEARRKRGRRNDRWALLTCGVVAFIMLFIMIAGMTAIVGWFR